MKEKRKICILGPVATPTYFGGVAVFDTELGTAFQNIGWEVQLLTEQNDAVHSDIVKRISNTRELRKLIGSFDPDYILASLNYGKYFSSLKDSNKKIYFLHGYFVRNYYGFAKSVIAPEYQKRLCARADFVFSNSYFTSAINEDFFDIKSDAVFHLAASHDFIDSLSENNARKKNTVFFAGRFVSVKRVMELVNAARYLQKSGIDYEIYLAGDGEKGEEIEKTINQSDLKITLLGRVEHTEIQKYYQKSDVFVSLNEAEPFGITFVEALLCGCKIICPYTGGQVEYLKDYPQTFFVNQSDPKDIADKIIQAFQMDEVPKITQKDIDYFSYERVAQEMISYLERHGN